MSEEPVIDQVCQIMADLFSVPKSSLGPETTPATLERWDSMGHLMLILQMEQDFGVLFAPEQVERMTSIALIAAELDSLA
jgi:acyl carrier protein